MTSRNPLALGLALAAALSGCGDSSADLRDPDADTPTNPSAELPTLYVETAEQAATLPAQVRGHLVLRGPGLTERVRVPQLSSVEGDLRVEAEALDGLELPALQRVTGACVIDGARALRALDVPALEACESLAVRDTEQLARLEAPRLARTRSLTLDGNRALSEVALPTLDLEPGSTSLSWGSVRVSDNHALNELTLPALTQATGVSLGANTRLRRLRLPALSGSLDSLTVYSDLLEELDLGSLESLVFAQLWTASLDEVALDALTAAGFVTVVSSSLRSLSLPVLAEADSLNLATPTLTVLSAPRLTTVGDLDAAGRRLSRVDLPMLAVGCDQVSLFRQLDPQLPACLAAAVLPSCPLDALTLRDDCTCGAEGDVSAASCPDSDE